MNTTLKIGTKFIIALIVGGIVGYALGVSRTQTQEARDVKKEPIKIGAIFSLTGNGAAYGEPARDALKLAVSEINAKGGIGGRMVEVIYEDSQFDPKIAVSAYRSLASRGVRYFFSNGSSVSAALKTPVVEDSNFNFEVGAVTPLYRDGKPTTCRATLTADVSGKALGEFIAKKLKLKTIAFLTLNDEFGTAVYENVRKTVEEAGVTVTGDEHFGKDDADFRTSITKLVMNNPKPDGLVVIPLGGQAQMLFKQLADQKWSGVTLSDNWTIINQQLKDISLAEGVYFSNYSWSPSSGADDAEKTAEFKRTFSSLYSYDPPVIAANAYDSFFILAEGLAKSDSASPEGVGLWLTKNVSNFSGVTGTVAINNPDCEGTREAIINQVKAGKFVRVE